MKAFIYKSVSLIFFLFVTLGSSDVFAQDKAEKSTSDGDSGIMKTYLIEREIPDVGQTSKEGLKAISQKSCSVLEKMDANKIQWVHSYVAEDKIYCIYKATDTELLREHAEKGGFPINSITEVSNVIGPATANLKIDE